MTIFKQVAFYLILLLSSTANAFVSNVDEGHPFQLYFDDEQPIVVEDSRATIDFLFQIPEHHYLYRSSIRVEFNNDKISDVLVTPAGIFKYDEFMGEETEVYYNQLAVLSKIQFDPDFDFSQQLTGNIYYQGCSDRICFRTIKQSFSFTLNPDQKTLNVSTTKKVTGGIGRFLRSQDIQSILKKGILFAMLITFLAGLFTSFTPCVLPIIPLTLAFIGATPHDKKSTKILHLLVFVSGMIVMYATLGVASAALGQTFGFIYQSSIFLIFLILFFVIMALWMFGVVQINVPSKLQSAISRYSPKGPFRYFYAGLTVGFLAAPCVGPIIGPLLVYISSTQDLKLGFILMMSYALGLSVLFFVLGFVSSTWVRKLGGESRLIKNVFGILLFLVAFYYLYVLINPYISRSASDGFFERDLQITLSKAKEENKNILIDFYADWCLPCHEWDKFVWSNQSVQQTVKETFVPLKIDCTKETKICEESVNRFKVIGWPTILFLDSSGQELPDKRIVGQVLSAKEFLEYIGDI